jgi:SAM-dependent methyltransferase
MWELPAGAREREMAFQLRSIIKSLVPDAILRRRVRYLIEREDEKFSASPVTRQQMFEAIYEKNLWGGEKGEFYSGTGSDDAVTASYVNCVRNFIEDRGVTKVVDIGCGDFRVGSKLVNPNIDYTGVDIVAPLIARNQEIFGSSNISFICRNAISDDLPDGELCLVRQVLQHLSNADIARILSKLSKYRYVIVTEGLPLKPKSFNRDKQAGPHVRLYWDSGVYLDQPPFSIQGTRTLVAVPIKGSSAMAPAKIVTTLIENPSAPPLNS